MTDRSVDITKIISQLVLNEILSGKIKTPKEIEWLTSYTTEALSRMLAYVIQIQEEKIDIKS